MAEAVYILCAVTSVVCALLLLRGFRVTRTKLLFWSSLCFAGLALNNLLLFADRLLVPSVDLAIPRNVVGLLSLMILLFGLIRESR